MSRSRLPLLLGLTAAGGAGYYLYGAGGSPKVAEKQFEGKFQNLADTQPKSPMAVFEGNYANGLETKNQPTFTRLPQK